MKDKLYYETNDRKYYFGYIKDKPHKDARLLLSPKEQAQLPASYIINDPTPVEDQGNLGSCTANAADNVSKIRSAIATGTFFNGSRLALYKWARDHDGSSGDVGSTLSSVAWVLANIGVPPESVWPYDISKFENEPPQSVRDAAAKDKTTKETRLDASNQSTTLANIKAAIAPNPVLPPCYPVMYGYDVPESFFNTGPDGNMPAPSGGIAGGHANVFIGYDDAHTGNYDGSKGALLSKNSWGTGFGARGLWWMPYSFFNNTNYEVGDCWAVITESDFGPTPPPTPPAPATHLSFRLHAVDSSSVTYVGQTFDASNKPAPGNKINFHRSSTRGGGKVTYIGSVTTDSSGSYTAKMGLVKGANYYWIVLGNGQGGQWTNDMVWI